MRIGALAAFALGTLVAPGFVSAALAQEEVAPPAEPADPLTELRTEMERQRARSDAQERRIEELESQLSAVSTAQSEADEAALLAADLEAAQEATPEAEPLRVYGFMDLGWQRFFLPSASAISGVISTEENSFVLGNINLYFDAQPVRNWRAMLELRFTNLPHGEKTEAYGSIPFSRIDRNVFDSTNPNYRNQVLLGNVIIERAWLDWGPMDELHIQAGYFFTPYGIWNIDHASPTLISLLLPESQVLQYMPLRQLGVQALGVIRAGAADIGYHAYVSNGRTVGQFDLTDDKAFGGRLFVRTSDTSYRLTVGASGYFGTFEEDETRIISLSPFSVLRTYPVQGQEGAVGIDVSLDAGGFRLRAEFTANYTEYYGDRRRIRYDGSLDPSGWHSDAYVILAYRLPWWGLEPYVYFEGNHGASSVADTTLIPSVGLNIFFNPQVQLKIQYSYALYAITSQSFAGDPSNNNFHLLALRLVMAL